MNHFVDLKIVKTIPAFPGFHVLELRHDQDGGIEPVLRPIVAWALEDEIFAPYPVTLEGVKTDAYILQPDGRVEKVCDCDYPSVAEWLKGQQEQQAVSRGEK
jgi:hypothetical protein